MAQVLRERVQDGDKVGLSIQSSTLFASGFWERYTSRRDSERWGRRRTLSNQPMTSTAALKTLSLCQTPIAAAVLAASSMMMPVCDPPIMAFCAAELAIRLPSCGT